MRIIIDLQGAQTQSRFRGIGRYTISLVKAMISNTSNEILLVLNGHFPESVLDIRNTFKDLIDDEKIYIWYGPMPISEINPTNLWRHETAEKIREAFLLKLNPDLILITSLIEGLSDNFVCSIGNLKKKILTAVILYDLIPLMNPNTYLTSKISRKWYENKVDNYEKADLILSISESARQEGIQYLNVNSDTIVNISTASDEIFHPIMMLEDEIDNLKLKFNIKKDFLLCSGATDDRKNHKRLINAFSKLDREVRNKHQLVLAGGLPDDVRNRFYGYAKEYGLNENDLIITGRVSDDELVKLYNLSKAFVFPSWHEGFGLPALEAMMCGKAVIASNTSSLPEVVGFEDALFDPFNINSIVEKMEKVLIDENFRINLENHCFTRSKLFSWESTAKIALKSIENCYEKNKIRNQNYNETEIRKLLIENIATQNSFYSEEDILKTAISISKNHRVENEYQLFVDISELIKYDNKTGIQRVVNNILNEFMKKKLYGFTIIPVYARTDKTYYYAYEYIDRNIHVDKLMFLDEPIKYYKGDVFLGLDLIHNNIMNLKKNIYDELYSAGVNLYFIVYDLLPIEFPIYSADGVSKNHELWLNVVTSYNGVFCISKSVLNSLNKWIKSNKKDTLNDFKIDYFPLGTEIYSTKLIDNNFLLHANLKDSMKKRFNFLMVGTLEPRKAHLQILRAFEILWLNEKDVNLIIVGKAGWKTESLINDINSHAELDNRLFWIKDADDSLLEEIYKDSTCLLAASYGEGFGLPLLEAAQRKLPIIARDIPVFREVAGDGAYYFDDTESISTVVNSLNEWIKLYDKNTHPKSDNIHYISWRESSNCLLNKILEDIK